jgi:hypothetical protein
MLILAFYYLEMYFHLSKLTNISLYLSSSTLAIELSFFFSFGSLYHQVTPDSHITNLIHTASVISFLFSSDALNLTLSVEPSRNDLILPVEPSRNDPVLQSYIDIAP